MSRLLKSKKGISPILATLLLIVIAVSAIIVTYAWVMTFMGTQGQTAGTLFKIQNVFWDEQTNETKIDIQNYGTSTVRITTIYIGTSAANTRDVTTFTDINGGILIQVEETATVTLSWPNDFGMMWLSGEGYYFKVAPSSGSEVTQGPYEAP